MAKIFVRERTIIGEGDAKPRFAVVGVAGTDMKFFKAHVRKGELETIAKSIDAEIVYLPRGMGKHEGEGEEGEGGKRKQARRKHSKGNNATST